MPRHRRKVVAAARAELARYHAERELTHSPRRRQIALQGILETQQDTATILAYIMAIGFALFRKDLEIFVAASGVLVALGVWRFGAAYRERIEVELSVLPTATGAGDDDTDRIEKALQVLFREAERSAVAMIIVGTLAGALAPLAWRLFDLVKAV